MISILLPSRGRPENVERLYKSLERTTRGKWEMLVRLDSDDPRLNEYMDGWALPRLRNYVGPRRLLSEMWNELLPHVDGHYLMHGGDDITFETEDWDLEVTAQFPPDGIAVVHGNDLSPNSQRISTHSFVTRKWVDTLGYLCPPYFASDYNDLWLTEVADALERRIYLPNVIIEHHHPAFGKAEWDQTHQDRVERHKAEGVDQIWESLAHERAEDVAKLRKVMG